jgi:hypothetical protein
MNTEATYSTISMPSTTGSAFELMDDAPTIKSTITLPLQPPILDISAYASSSSSSSGSSSPSPLSPTHQLEVFGNLLATAAADAQDQLLEPYESTSTSQRRLPFFVRLTEREARRRKHNRLMHNLFMELNTHRRNLARFKRAHTNRLLQLEHERVAPMEAAVAAATAAAAAAVASGISSPMAMQFNNGRLARAAVAAARQRGRLSPTELAKNRSLSERAVHVLKLADQLEVQCEVLIQKLRDTWTCQAQHEAVCSAMTDACEAHRLTAIEESDEDEDNASDTEFSDHSSTDHASSITSPDELITEIEQTCTNICELILQYPA